VNAYASLANPVALAVFTVTLLLPVAVGVWAMRRTRSQSDFFVGGRAMNRFVVALSAVSSGRSSWLVLGVSGMAYARGVGAVWAVVGYIVVELFQFVFVGRRLREESARFGSITLLDWMASRFDDRRNVLRVTAAVIVSVFLTAYVAAQLNAGGKALGAALGWPVATGVVVSALLILAYMLLGGFVAVAFNDVVRAVIMLAGLVLLPALGLLKLGGETALVRQLQALDPALVDPWSLGLGALVGFVGIGLGSPGQPHILVRYMSIDDPDRLRSSAVIGTVTNVILGWGAVHVGLVGRLLVPDLGALPNRDPEMIYLVLTGEMLGPALFGLLVGGVFAAILSTADSQLLVVGSTIGRDVWEMVLRRGRAGDERQLLRVSRVVLLVAGAAAVGLAIAAQDLVFWLVLFAWAGLGASIGSVVLLGLFWPGLERNGALAALVTGAVVTIVWRLWLKAPTGIYELIPALGLALVAGVVTSLFRKGSGLPSTLYGPP
jgi:sodium/proline symporter